MFKKTFLIVAIFVIVWTLYMISNREYFIREHLTNKNPTLLTLQKDVDETNKKVKDLDHEFQEMKTQGQAQSAQAAAAMASLKAIPAGTPNKIIPTR